MLRTVVAALALLSLLNGASSAFVQHGPTGIVSGLAAGRRAHCSLTVACLTQDKSIATGVVLVLTPVQFADEK